MLGCVGIGPTAVTSYSGMGDPLVQPGANNSARPRRDECADGAKPLAVCILRQGRTRAGDLHCLSLRGFTSCRWRTVQFQYEGGYSTSTSMSTMVVVMLSLCVFAVAWNLSWLKTNKGALDSPASFFFHNPFPPLSFCQWWQPDRASSVQSQFHFFLLTDGQDFGGAPCRWRFCSRPSMKTVVIGAPNGGD